MIAIARKELRDVMREKSLVTAFLVQALLAGFSALLLTGLTALHSPDSIQAAPDATIGYVGPGGFDAYLDEAGNLDVVPLDAQGAIDAFETGRVAAIIEERYDDPADERRITLVLPDGELQSTLLVTQLKGLLLDYEADLREDRAARLQHDLVAIEDADAGTWGFVQTTLLPLMVVTPVMLSGAIAGDALSQESRSRTLLLLRSAPISAARLVAGKLLVPVLLVPIQVALWILLFWLNGHATAAPLALLGLATLLGILMTTAGTLVAAFVRSETWTQATYAVLLLILGVGSLLLPRDPLNVVALVAAGSVDGAAWVSIGAMAVATVVTSVGAVWVTKRRIEADRL